MIQVYFDGSPEKMAVIIEGVEYIKDHCIDSVDPVEIEYTALLYALNLVSENSSIELYSDNQTIVAQLHSRHYHPSKEGNEYYNQVKQLLKQKTLSCDIFWIPRNMNPAGKLI